MKVFERERKVVAADLDELNHVNNVTYLAWVQEMSRDHWQQRASAQQQRDYVWVVRKHEITYHGAALLDDDLLLRTYIHANKGPISTRKVEIWHKENERLLVGAQTDWCLLDPRSMRPVRVPQEISTLFI